MENSIHLKLSLSKNFFERKNIFVSFKLILLTQSCQTTTQTQQYPDGVSYTQSQNNWVVDSKDEAKVFLKDSEHTDRFLQREVEKIYYWLLENIPNIFVGVHCSRHDQNLWLFQNFETAAFWLIYFSACVKATTG